MDRQAIINKTLNKLSKLNTISIDQMVDKIKDGTVPEASVPRTVVTFAEKNNYGDDEKKQLMEHLLESEVHKLSDKHLQRMEYLRDKMFKIPRSQLSF